MATNQSNLIAAVKKPVQQRSTEVNLRYIFGKWSSLNEKTPPYQISNLLIIVNKHNNVYDYASFEIGAYYFASGAVFTQLLRLKDKKNS